MSSQDTNVVSITGTAGREIEMHFTQSGNAFLAFQVGVHRTGRRGRLTTWISCVAWGALGKMLETRMAPGSWLFVSGALEAPLQVGPELPAGRGALELVASRVVLLGVPCPCAEGGACSCQDGQEELAEEFERGGGVYDLVAEGHAGPGDEALVE